MQDKRAHAEYGKKYSTCEVTQLCNESKFEAFNFVVLMEKVQGPALRSKYCRPDNLG